MSGKDWPINWLTTPVGTEFTGTGRPESVRHCCVIDQSYAVCLVALLMAVVLFVQSVFSHFSFGQLFTILPGCVCNISSVYVAYIQQSDL